MSTPTPPAFDEPMLAALIEQLSEAEIHALPYGAIRLDREGRVLLLSDTEARQSGYGSRPAQGRLFFSDIAPCLANDSFRGRIEHALAAGILDIEMEHVGDFDDLNKLLRYRVQSAAGGGVWIFTQRL